jgi:hypothetical protein
MSHDRGDLQVWELSELFEAPDHDCSEEVCEPLNGTRAQSNLSQMSSTSSRYALEEQDQVGLAPEQVLQSAPVDPDCGEPGN